MSIPIVNGAGAILRHTQNERQAISAYGALRDTQTAHRICSMEIGKEIRRRRKALGWTLQELENRTGISNGNLSRLEQGKQGYTPESIQKIADAFGVKLADLFASESNVAPLPIVGQVPLISWVQAGAWCEAADPYNVGDAESWLPCPVKHGPRTYALRVRGESMFNPGGQPSFADGDIIFCDPGRDAYNKSLVIARLDDSKEATFKRLLIDGEKRFLEALNPSWPNRIFEIEDNTTVCGVIIARLESFV